MGITEKRDEYDELLGDIIILLGTKITPDEKNIMSSYINQVPYNVILEGQEYRLDLDKPTDAGKYAALCICKLFSDKIRKYAAELLAQLEEGTFMDINTLEKILEIGHRVNKLAAMVNFESGQNILE